MLMLQATFFVDDRQARSGLAKFLFKAADGKREHAKSMLQCLEKRGVRYNTLYNFNGLDKTLYDVRGSNISGRIHYS